MLIKILISIRRRFTARCTRYNIMW